MKRPGFGSILIAMQCLIAAVGSASGDHPDDSTAAASLSRLTVSADADSATVYIDGQVKGITPLSLDSVSSGTRTLVVIGRNPASWFSKSDSMTVVLAPGEARRLMFSILTPIRLGPTALPEVSPLLQTGNDQNGRLVALYASGGIAVAAGVAAAYFKISADDRNAAYQMTGNPALLDERRRLDTASGFAFAAMQVGLAVFSYLLLAE
jgi:hypothetical protein